MGHTGGENPKARPMAGYAEYLFYAEKVFVAEGRQQRQLFYAETLSSAKPIVGHTEGENV